MRQVIKKSLDRDSSEMQKPSIELFTSTARSFYCKYVLLRS
jgi:hypothetical protein